MKEYIIHPVQRYLLFILTVFLMYTCGKANYSKENYEKLEAPEQKLQDVTMRPISVAQPSTICYVVF